MLDDLRNGSGFFDPTAYEAIRKADLEAELNRLHKLLEAINMICDIADFRIEERIVVRDKRTGKTDSKPTKVLEIWRDICGYF